MGAVSSHQGASPASPGGLCGHLLGLQAALRTARKKKKKKVWTPRSGAEKLHRRRKTIALRPRGITDG